MDLHRKLIKLRYYRGNWYGTYQTLAIVVEYKAYVIMDTKIQTFNSVPRKTCNQFDTIHYIEYVWLQTIRL